MSFIIDSLFGGAEKKAGQAQAAAQAKAEAEGRAQQAQTRRDFAGGIGRGEDAGNRLNDFLGLNGQEAEQQAVSGFTESPGQAFLRERQERSLLRNSAALGGLGGGNVRTALQEQAYSIADQQLGERKDRLSGVAAIGANAVTNQAGIGAGISRGIQGAQVGIGDANARGILGQASGIRRGLGQVAGAFTGTGALGNALGGATAGIGPSFIGGGGGALGLTKTFVNPLTGT